MRRRERRGKQLLDEFKKTWRYWRLKKEVLARSQRGTHFRRGYGPIVKTDYMILTHYPNAAISLT